MRLHELLNRRDDVVQLYVAKAGIHTDEHRLVHEDVRSLQVANDAEWRCRELPIAGLILSLQDREHRLADQITAKQHPIADTRSIERTGQLASRKWRRRFDSNH